MENENGERPKETKEGPRQDGSKAPNGQSKAWERHDQYYRYYYGQPYYPQYYPQTQYGGWGWGWHYTPSAAQRSKKPKPRRSSKPAVAGALLILAGIIAIFVGGAIGMFMNNSSMLTGMSEWDSGDNGLGAVSGQVIYQNLSPVVNAKITVVETGQVGFSNDTGQYRILNVETGWHDIRVEKEGYITMVQSVQVVEGTVWSGIPDLADITTTDFQLQPGTGEIRIGDPHEGDGDWSGGEARGLGFLRSITNFCMATTIIFGAIAIIGGYLSIQRRHFPFVVVAGFFGIMSIGAGLSAVLSIIALFILFLSSDEFDKARKRMKKKKGRKRKGGRYYGHYNQPASGPSPNYGHAPGQRGPYQQQYPQYQPYQQRYYQPTLQHPRWIPPGPGQY